MRCWQLQDYPRTPVSLDRGVVSDSFVTGFCLVMLIVVGLALASALIAWLAIRVPKVAVRGPSVNVG